MNMSSESLAFLEEDILKNNTINSEAYNKFEVKRGLRNKDGSGVLAGLTHISSVLGFHKVEGELMPIEGVLKYRGTPLKEIIEQAGPSDRYFFERICFLLLVGRLPSQAEFEPFLSYFIKNRELPDELLTHVIKAIPSKNIMNKLQTSISALYAFDESADSMDPYENFLKAIRILAKLPLILSYSYLSAFDSNPEYLSPPKGASQAEAFLYTLKKGAEISEEEINLMDLSLVLHAEHGGGNNSTFTTYVVSSSGSDIYSTLAAAVASLKGPLHGAANQKVMDMMSHLKENISQWDDPTEVGAYLEKMVRKEVYDKSGKLFGLGHAVYTKSDPRAIVIREQAEKVVKQSQREKELALYDLVAKLGPEVFQAVKKSDKVISPNVDFYSGLVYECLGIPRELYTPMFAMARACGWCAHRIEESLSGKRIIRPGYKYIDVN